MRSYTATSLIIENVLSVPVSNAWEIAGKKDFVVYLRNEKAVQEHKIPVPHTSVNTTEASETLEDFLKTNQLCYRHKQHSVKFVAIDTENILEK